MTKDNRYHYYVNMSMSVFPFVYQIATSVTKPLWVNNFFPKNEWTSHGTRILFPIKFSLRVIGTPLDVDDTLSLILVSEVPNTFYVFSGLPPLPSLEQKDLSKEKTYSQIKFASYHASHCKRIFSIELSSILVRVSIWIPRKWHGLNKPRVTWDVRLHITTYSITRWLYSQFTIRVSELRYFIT